MNKLTLSIWLCLAAAPVLANPGGVPNGGVGNGRGNGNQMHSAPAPLIGFGIPSAVALGGGLIALKLLARKRRQTI